jgi:ankyrin repeat protein
VSVLLAAGADTDYSSPMGNFKGKTALMWSSSQGRLDAVAVLLTAGAQVNKGDYDGVTALMWASGSETSGDAEHKKGLLEKANKGDMLADVVSLLMSYRASIDARDKDGITAVMYASYHGHDGVVRALMRAGADITYRNKAGQTAVQLAHLGNHTAAAEALLTIDRISNLPIPSLLKVPTCGWMLSIFRSYSRHQNYYRPSGDNDFSVAKSCAGLNAHGLDGTLEEIVEIVLGSSVEEVIGHFGELSFGNKVRIRADLKYIVDKATRNSTRYSSYLSQSCMY